MNQPETSLLPITQSTKILLSVFCTIPLFYFLVLMFPVSFSFMFPSMEAYTIQIIISNLCLIVVTIYSIARLWKYKKIKKAIKINWTVLLLLFAVITNLIYIWNKDDEFLSKNKQV